MDDALIARFAAIVGDRYAVRAADDIAPYVSEPRGLYGGVTPLVLRPGSTEEVSRIMALASETRTPVVPQGGNTGLVGGQMPDQTGTQIVLSLSRLNRIRELDVLSNTATVEAGVILEVLQQAADEADRLYPLALASQGSCQVGGNLSSNAGGVGALAYGVARDLCLGIEVVLPTGEMLDDVRKLKKDNTGYDLKDLFIGAEGTLGVITAAVVKLFPKPKGREMAWIGLPSCEAAFALLGRANEAAGAGLTMFELAHRRPMDFTAKHLPSPPCPIPLNCEWYVLMEISSGRSAQDARELIEAILGSALEDGVIEDAAIAANLAQARDFWQLRENMPEAQKPEGASIKHDVSLPIAAIPEFVQSASEAVLTLLPGARLIAYGHLGDGNLHFNFTQPEGGSPSAFSAQTPAVTGLVHDLVARHGGSFSAEHGVGQSKVADLRRYEDPVSLELMRKLKCVIDPLGIMNPGKVL